MPKGHNKPPLVLELDEDMVEFLEKNCDSNITMGLTMLQRANDAGLGRESLEKIIKLGEQFKKLKKLLNEAKKERDQK